MNLLSILLFLDFTVRCLVNFFNVSYSCSQAQYKLSHFSPLCSRRISQNEAFPSLEACQQFFKMLLVIELEWQLLQLSQDCWGTLQISNNYSSREVLEIHTVHCFKFPTQAISPYAGVMCHSLYLLCFQVFFSQPIYFIIRFL